MRLKSSEESILWNHTKITFWSFLISNQEGLISILHIFFLCLNKWESTFSHKFVAMKTKQNINKNFDKVLNIIIELATAYL